MYQSRTGKNKGILVITLESVDEFPVAVQIATGSSFYAESAWAPDIARLKDEGEIEIPASLTSTGRPVHIELLKHER